MTKDWKGPLPLTLQHPSNSLVPLSYVRGTYENNPNIPPLLDIPIGKCFDQQVEKFPEREALVVSQQNIRWTWQQFQVTSILSDLKISAPR